MWLISSTHRCRTGTLKTQQKHILGETETTSSSESEVMGVLDTCAKYFLWDHNFIFNVWIIMTFEVIRPPLKPLLRSSLYIRFSCTCSNFKTYISLSWIHLKIEDTHYFFKFSFMKDEFLVCIDEKHG